MIIVLDSDEKEVLLSLAFIDSSVQKRIWIHDIKKYTGIMGNSLHYNNKILVNR